MSLEQWIEWPCSSYRVRELRQLPSRENLYRLKLLSDSDGACRVKTTRDLSDKKSANSIVESKTQIVKNSVKKAWSYFVFLLETLQKDIRLNADIVSGMASFVQQF